MSGLTGGALTYSRVGAGLCWAPHVAVTLPLILGPGGGLAQVPRPLKGTWASWSLVPRRRHLPGTGRFPPHPLARFPLQPFSGRGLGSSSGAPSHLSDTPASSLYPRWPRDPVPAPSMSPGPGRTSQRPGPGAPDPSGPKFLEPRRPPCDGSKGGWGGGAPEPEHPVCGNHVPGRAAPWSCRLLECLGSARPSPTVAVPVAHPAPLHLGPQRPAVGALRRRCPYQGLFK